MYKNTIGKSKLVAFAAVLVLAIALVASQAAGWQEVAAAERAQLSDAAHSEALAQHYAERALAADAAHWRSLAEHYAEAQANR